MLLTVSTTHQPATDLGYLLVKNPASAQCFDVGFGMAHVVYPEANAERCTAALILDIDPVALVRGRCRDGGSRGGEGGLLSQYVNDRPYAASSFLSVALGRVFGSAMTGKSEAKPELVGAALPLVARLVPIACNGGAALIERLFAPLGYTVTAVPVAGAAMAGEATSAASSTAAVLVVRMVMSSPREWSDSVWTHPGKGRLHPGGQSLPRVLRSSSASVGRPRLQ